MNIGLPFMTVVVFVQLDEAHDVKKAQEQLQKTVSDMQTTLQRIQAPNMRAMEKCVPSTSLATAFLSVGVCVCVYASMPTVLYRVHGPTCTLEKYAGLCAKEVGPPAHVPWVDYPCVCVVCVSACP